jgi:hypothetical protein
MHDLALIDEYYKKYMQNLSQWIPEGIYTINLELLRQFDLLHFRYGKDHDPTLTRYFHIVEAPEKITLVNDEFIIWIVPDQLDDVPITYTLIAINREDQPKLELAFIASGVYNTSNLVLRILEKFLIEIQENEKLIEKISLSP